MFLQIQTCTLVRRVLVKTSARGKKSQKRLLRKGLHRATSSLPMPQLAKVTAPGYVALRATESVMSSSRFISQ
jgi:predicted GNAT family N-acyltransferase